jgi:hypothetical protein
MNKGQVNVFQQIEMAISGNETITHAFHSECKE